MLKDKFAICYGGPLDGGKLFSDWATEGSTFVPAKTTENRPEYIFKNEKWIFNRYLPPGE